MQPTTVEYMADIHNGFALCKLRQVYNINIDDIDEASYQFPVDYNSAFCDLIIKTPRNEIKGIVREKSEAKEIYNQAKRTGLSAYLAEETDDDRDIYKLSMCNMIKGDTIVVEYTYVTELEYDNGQNIFYVPSFISQRYGGKFIPSPTHNISMEILLNNNPTSLQCSVPDVCISVDDNRLVLKYSFDQPLDKDIEIKFANDFEEKAYKFEYDGYDIAIMQFIPSKTNNLNSPTKDIVFVLDCSGSMNGDRINNAKKAIIHCLNKLKNQNYQFNILKYGSKTELYSSHMLSTTGEEITKAIEYCQNINANMGGTETLKALQYCLSLSKSAILITDGDTSDNNALHSLCKKFDCLSILGIGSGINRGNIVDMAKRGSGIARFCQNSGNIIKNIETIFKSMTYSFIRNYSVRWEGDASNSLSSSDPIIYENHNTVYSINWNKNKGENIFIDGSDITFRMTDSNTDIDQKYLGALAAKRIIQCNTIGGLFTKEKLVDLAVRFNIITQHTSMIAVDKDSDHINDSLHNIPKNNDSDNLKESIHPSLACLFLPKFDKDSDQDLYNSITSDPNDTTTFDPTFNMVHNKNNNVCASSQDKSTDYLFDYFMNESKFNEQVTSDTATNTIGSSLKNATHDIRGNIPNPVSMQSLMYEDASVNPNLKYLKSGTTGHSIKQLFAPTGAISYGPNVKMPVQQVYNINLPGPAGGHTHLNKIYENILPRTTTRETTVEIPHNNFITPVEQLQGGNNYQDIARTTIKETTCSIPWNTHVTSINQQQRSSNPFDSIRTTMKEVTVQTPANNVNTHIFTKKDYYIHSIPQRPCETKQNVVPDRNTENLCNMVEKMSYRIKNDHIQTSDAEYLYNILENISDETVTIIKNQNIDKIFNHFDFQVGLFKKSVWEDMVGMDKINEFVTIKNDRYALTVLILYFSHKIWLCNNFEKYFSNAMCNKIFSELINNKKYNLTKFFR